MDSFLIYIVFDIIAAIIAISAESLVHGRYSRYRDVSSNSTLTGADVARKILRDNDITDVAVGVVGGKLSDHYNNRKKELNLSSDVYNGSSIASIAIAAHEAGHAIQYKQHYFPIAIRNVVIPVTNFASKMFIPLLIIGILVSAFSASGIVGEWFIYGSLILLGLSVVVNLVTLPVEFNASKRAMQQLKENFDYGTEEIDGAKSMLTAAALTYVASLAISLIYVLRFLLIFGRFFLDNR